MALQRIALVSLPASGSDSENAPRTSPAAILGSHFCFCSSVPNRLIRFEPIMCVLSTPDNDIHPKASSSTTRA